MRYQLKRRLFSVPSRFMIQNDLGEDVGYVMGEWALSGELLVMDVRGKELARIRKVPFSMPGTHEIYRDGHLSAVIYREKVWTTVGSFTIDVPGSDDYTAQGDFTGHEYFLVRHGKAVAHISRQWFTLEDTYGVEMLNDEDAVLVLAATIVIDISLHHN